MKTKMVLYSLALVIISGCETTKMSMELAGATVGAAVGGFGGAQLGSGLGMWAYSAGGVIVGGLVGYEGGRILKESDMTFYKGAANKALSSDGNGTTTNWKNPETGHSGVFRPLKRIITLNGQTCRHFRSTVAFVNTVESGNGIACQQVDGTWKIISNYFG